MGKSPTEWINLCSPQSPVGWHFRNCLGDLYVWFSLIKINKYQWASKSPMWFWELQQHFLPEREACSVPVSWAQIFPGVCLHILTRNWRFLWNSPRSFIVLQSHNINMSWLYSRSYKIPRVRSKVNWPFCSQVNSCFVMLMRSVEEIMMRGKLCFINTGRAQRTHHLKTCLWVVGHEKENQDVRLCYAFMIILMGKGQQS